MKRSADVRQPPQAAPTWTLGPRWLVAASLFAACLVALPILAVVLNLFQPAGDAWGHVAGSVVPRYLATTGWLALGVGASTALLGVGSAWLVVSFRFPGRALFEWALILPLAMPSYVMAYSYYEFLSFSGPVQETIRSVFGLGPRDYWFPRIASLPGAVFVLSLALYPYVYLAARAAFLQQSGTVLEVSRTLGCTRGQAFFRVMLPLARPAIAVGLSLVLMETLAEYGAVSLLGVQTFTTGIYRAWFSMGDPAAASRLAVMLLTAVFVLVLLERSSRRGSVVNAGVKHRSGPGSRLTGWRAWGATALASLPLLFGFLLPCAYLAALLARLEPGHLDAGYLTLAGRSFGLALTASALAVALALLMVYAARLSASALPRAANRVAAMGYALPGPVIAIGVLVPLAAFDNALDGVMEAWFGIDTGLLVTGSAAVLILAYLARFMTVALGGVEAGFAKIKPSLEDAASTLGKSAIQRLAYVHAPLIWPALGTALLLVFVDVMKELPATLILRPFNFDTLAVRTYNLAADERIAEAALPAFTLVLVGLLPVILLARQVARGQDVDAR